MCMLAAVHSIAPVSMSSFSAGGFGRRHRMDINPFSDSDSLSDTAAADNCLWASEEPLNVAAAAATGAIGVPSMRAAGDDWQVDARNYIKRTSSPSAPPRWSPGPHQQPDAQRSHRMLPQHHRQQTFQQPWSSSLTQPATGSVHRQDRYGSRLAHGAIPAAAAGLAGGAMPSHRSIMAFSAANGGPHYPPYYHSNSSSAATGSGYFEGSDGTDTEGSDHLSFCCGETPGSPPPGVEIFVGGLTRASSAEMLYDWFCHLGEITEVRVARDKRRRRCRGYGFVRFRNSEQANLAIEAMQGYQFKKGCYLGMLPSDENRTLYVSGMCQSWSQDQVHAYFSANFEGVKRQVELCAARDAAARRAPLCWRRVASIRMQLVWDRETPSRLRPFCFVEFDTHEHATSAHARYHPDSDRGSSDSPIPTAGASNCTTATLSASSAPASDSTTTTPSPTLRPAAAAIAAAVDAAAGDCGGSDGGDGASAGGGDSGGGDGGSGGGGGGGGGGGDDAAGSGSGLSIDALEARAAATAAAVAAGSHRDRVETDALRRAYLLRARSDAATAGSRPPLPSAAAATTARPPNSAAAAAAAEAAAAAMDEAALLRVLAASRARGAAAAAAAAMAATAAPDGSFARDYTQRGDGAPAPADAFGFSYESRSGGGGATAAAAHGIGGSEHARRTPPPPGLHPSQRQQQQPDGFSWGGTQSWTWPFAGGAADDVGAARPARAVVMPGAAAGGAMASGAYDAFAGSPSGSFDALHALQQQQQQRRHMLATPSSPPDQGRAPVFAPPPLLRQPSADAAAAWHAQLAMGGDANAANAEDAERLSDYDAWRLRT
ncbi:hypothetical protein JKP88DRAFT_311469 [Tribonema minus]|uniref:RRM domain-containing protein n=1 Tax=Tribonema minus TaxID=303371 RepID=A0A836CJD8_9STRA|nr:hypothetical protein JKP88DRAFT_311469 [Tribonema minus]